MPARNMVSNPVMDWVGVELVEDTVYLVVELEWRARGEFGGRNLDLPGRVHATGSLHLSEEGWRTFGIALASGDDPVRMFEGAWQITWREGFEFADPKRDDVTGEVKVAAAGIFRLPNEVVRMSLPPFLLRRMGGIERVEQAVAAITRLNFDEALMYREYYQVFLEMGPFEDEQGHEVLCILRAAVETRPGIPQISDEAMWGVIRREVGRGVTYIDDLYRLQLLTRRRVEIDENPKSPEGEGEEEAPQKVANLQRSREDLEDLEKVFADIRLSFPDREGGEVMRAPPGTKLSFHALPVGKLKIQIGTHHTDALVDGGAEITLIRRDFATITGYTVNKEVTGSIRGAGGEISFAGYVTKCAVKAGIRESIWSFQRMIVMEEMDHDIIVGRPWCAKVEMIGMHLHDDSYMVDIEDPVTGRGELLRLLGTGGEPPKGKLATWSPSFEDSTRKGAFARMEDQLPLDVRDRPYTAMHTPVGQLQMQVTPMGFTNAVAKAQRRMLVVARDMFPKKCEPYIYDNPIKGAQEKDETEVQPGIRRFVWDHQQDIKDLLRRFLVYNITVSGPKSILAVPEVAILGFCCGAYGRKPDPAKTDKISQWPTPLHTRTEFKKEVLAILHCLKTFQAYLFGRRFILRIDPTNVAGALKNYRPIDPTVGRWVGFIWQFDYKIERIAGIRNKAGGLSRVCITPEGLEDAEPIDAFLEYEGGTLAVDNEMMDGECVSGELLIRTLEKGAPAVVAELREGPVTTRGRKKEKDSWGAIVGPKEDIIAMVVEGGREAVMSLVES
ncbi:hypothetical protein CBR_g28852 [Chara braunii]|uniref:Peptidase A2 domain-containing protein n=1 Tax=Chara braunii TaxID=69332 RepID=A0A388L9Z8_CHABU|nr:hypothetical protein CBR_g28852 [Chara braunii]|eukprot:GBG79137.1 hypothetical protein CBR_g28852 [Chara braunii]